MGEFRLWLLGPVGAERDGRPLALGRRKQRALLALLARDANRVVSIDAIVDALWPESPPATARHSVEVYASGLRRALGDGRIDGAPGGYRLRVEPGEVDAERLASAVERAPGARPARARRLLEEALSLVAGDPLTGLVELPFAALERARLDELVLSAREQLLEARLELGEHEALVGELRSLAAGHPTHERLHRLLVLALYRSGRAEEALGAYRGAVAALRDLGLEPGPELRGLERRLLLHDPALLAPPPRPPTSVLPAPMHPLLGRERELTELGRLLRADARLVTVIGPGGVGKTRLAVAVARELLPEIDAAYFVGLDAVRDPAMALAAVADALGAAEPRGDGPAERIVRRLGDGETLLVVDNVEHLLAVAPALAELLAGCPQLRILVTSRVPLRLYGEHLYPLEPLAVPAEGSSPAEIASSASVALFAARARAVRPGFALTGDEAPAVAAICRRLDGLPLAIELAAARIDLLGPAALLERLEQRLDVGEGPRDAPDRQRTLGAAIAWSYKLLPPDAQAVFRRLGVFVRGASPAAVDHVCSEDAAEHVRELVAHNLLRREAGGRVSLLETIREYALLELERSGEAADARARHLEYFLELAEAAEPELRRSQPRELLAALEAEHPNLLAALRYACAAGRADLELRLAIALWYAFSLRGDDAQSLRLLEDAFARAEVPGPTPAPLRAAALMTIANAAAFSGEAARGLELGHEALRLAEEAGDDFVRFKALDVISVAAAMTEGPEAGLEWGERAIAAARGLDDPWSLGTALNNTASHCVELHRYGQALPMLEEALACFERIGNVDGMAFVYANLGVSDAALGRPGHAARHFAASLERAREVNRGLAIDVLPHVALLLARSGRAGDAGRLLGAHERHRSAVTERPLHEVDAAALRAAAESVASDLDRAAADGTRAEGAAFALDTAFAWALELSHALGRA